jgi:hypothetical protein
MDQEQQERERDLADIDRRRAELELVIGTISPNCVDYREQLESELNALWNLRCTLAEQLRPRQTLREKLAADPRFVEAKKSGQSYIIPGAKPS